MQVGRVNGEVARGLWAALSMELYYFTNDDDERYADVPTYADVC
jgi:hypothetical protein